MARFFFLSFFVLSLFAGLALAQEEDGAPQNPLIRLDIQSQDDAAGDEGDENAESKPEEEVTAPDPSFVAPLTDEEMEAFEEAQKSVTPGNLLERLEEIFQEDDAKDEVTLPGDEDATSMTMMDPTLGAVVVQALDKITARTSSLTIPINEIRQFGSLRILPRYCYKAPPEERPEAASFLQIVDVKPNQDPLPIFSGWMFASSPSLSALEHPVYDIVVKDCVAASKALPEISPSGDTQSAAPSEEGN